MGSYGSLIFPGLGGPEENAWQTVSGSSGSFWDDVKSAIDNVFFGTLSPQQQHQLDEQAISQINQAASGNTSLATSEINQYKSDVANAVYNQLPAGVDEYIAGIKKYLPWVAGGLILLYLAPVIARISR